MWQTLWQRFDRRWLVGGAYARRFATLESLTQVGIFRDVGISPWDPAAGLTYVLAHLGGVYYAPFIFLAPMLMHYFDYDLRCAVLASPDCRSGRERPVVPGWAVQPAARICSIPGSDRSVRSAA